MMMQNILELVQSDPQMLTTLAQLLGDQTETLGGAATTEGARPEEVVLVRYYLKSAHCASLNYMNYSYR